MHRYSELFDPTMLSKEVFDHFVRCECCILPYSYTFQIMQMEKCQCSNRSRISPLGSQTLLDQLKQFNKIAVTVSGGKDSTYTWLWLVEHLGSERIVPINFSHTGLQHRVALDNLSESSRILQTEVIHIRDDEFRKRFSKNLEIFLDNPCPELVRVVLCAGCRYGISSALYEECDKRGIRAVVNSASYLELAPFKTQLLSNLGNGDIDAGLMKALNTDRRYFWGNNISTILRDNKLEYKKNISTGATSIYGNTVLFDFDEYVPNDPQQFESIITERLNWKRPSRSWHFDCLIEEFKDVFYYGLLGYTEADFKLSSMVQYGLISRSDALRQIAIFNRLIVDGLPHMISLMNELGLGHLIDKMKAFYAKSPYLKEADYG